MSGIVVVDRPVEDRVVVWHVSVGDGLESTMAGAWVLPLGDERVEHLVAGRLLVTTDRVPEGIGVGADPAVLAKAIRAEMDKLDGAFSGHVASLPASRRGLVRPRWPRMPMHPRAERAGDPLASRALTVARWVSRLLTAWSDVEKERLARPFLVLLGGDVAREYPPGWPTAITQAEEPAA